MCIQCVVCSERCVFSVVLGQVCVLCCAGTSVCFVLCSERCVFCVVQEQVCVLCCAVSGVCFVLCRDKCAMFSFRAAYIFQPAV